MKQVCLNCKKNLRTIFYKDGKNVCEFCCQKIDRKKLYNKLYMREYYKKNPEKRINKPHVIKVDKYRYECYDTVSLYPSYCTMSKAVGLSSSTLYNIVKGKTKKYAHIKIKIL